MPNVSIFDVVGQTRPKRKTKPSKKTRGPKKKVEKKQRWGTPEEKYRRVCMMCLLFRYGYYVHSKQVISEHEYNALEKFIRAIEDQDRSLVNPNSPTLTVGSENKADYPRSVAAIWNMHERDDALHQFADILPVIVGDAEKEFGIKCPALSGGKSRKNSRDF